MKDENKHIELLLERFFNGETNNQEEQELYLFFSQDIVPEHLAKYKAIFSYFESGLLDEVKETTSYPINVKSNKLQKWIIPIISVAATLFILLVINYSINRNKNNSHQFVSGYVIKNGVKIYDQKIVEAEYNAILLEVENKRKEIQTIKEEAEKELQEHYSQIKEMTSINNNHQ